jgi:hypothetical protein
MKSVLVMRLAVWGVVLVLGGAVLAARADRSPPERQPTLFHGQTPEGEPAAIGTEEGKVHAAHMRWHVTCERDRSPEVSTITFGPQYGDRFENRGREFSFRGRDTQQAGDGRAVRYEVELQGTLSRDGRSATGHGRTTETWIRDGRVVDVCRSEDVPWTVHRGVLRG